MDLIAPLMLGTVGFLSAFTYINMVQTGDRSGASQKRRDRRGSVGAD
ncbi:hypothetical protein RGUI_0998 [Rhodovulum sp. P5]|nr:hypothetical protein [Rhodovulum sp. P5]ARE39139.1 hypothetical protein RGUI_0998 [Rhodovulum sp. P5]